MPRSDIFHGISFPPCFARRDLSTPLLFGNCAIRFVGEDEVGLFAVPATDTELSPIFVLLFESVSVRDLCFGSLRRVLFPQDNMRADAHRVVSSTIVYILHIRKGFLLQRGCLSYKHSPVLRCERKWRTLQNGRARMEDKWQCCYGRFVVFECQQAENLFPKHGQRQPSMQQGVG